MKYLTAPVALLLSVLPLACATRVQAGAASAPSLGGSPAFDAAPRDAIANADGSCEVRAEGSPLRYRSPACPRFARWATPPALVVAHPTVPGSAFPIEPGGIPFCAWWESLRRPSGGQACACGRSPEREVWSVACLPGVR